MATVTDVEVANASFPNVRQDLNDILEALASNFSNDAEPTTMYPNQFWYETDSNLLYLRNEDNDAWITLAFFDQTNDEWEVRTGVVQAANGDGLALKTDEGTTRVSIADDGSVTVNTSLDVDNIKIDGNSITSTDTNGDINITPDGTGKVVLDGLNYPTADGTDGQVLTTDGSGNIAFEDAGGAGKVLQVVSTTKTDTFSATSVASNGKVSVTGLSASITPTSTSSKILVMYSVCGSTSTGVRQPSVAVVIERDGSEVKSADAAGSRANVNSVSVLSLDDDVNQSGNVSSNFIDEPSSTSSLTYQVRLYNLEAGSANLFCNRTVGDANTNNFRPRSTSTITLMEIAG